ncbi:AMP-binding protein [Variovorax sp. SRS16]|uniref:AMP-binding protein n=1 Tax=Variovorax sp. SRS16 TaxID=282217 RepID=UPI0013A56EC3|nr:AMP-binding protein [Variovorax sp. SRS16]
MTSTLHDGSSPHSMPPLEARTLGAAFEARLRVSPDKLAVRDTERGMSYAQLHEESLAFSSGFSRLGLARQGFALLMLDNHLDYVIAWYALSLSGRVEVPVNTAYKGSILAHVINNSGAKLIVIEAHYLPVLADVADRLEKIEHVVVRGDASAHAATLPPRFRVLPWEALRGPREAPVHVDPWDLLGILYTSGTTGPSKGVRVTHAHAYGYASPTVLGLVGADDVQLCTLPLFHIGGQWAAIYGSLIGGGSAVLLPRFSATTFWDDVRKYGCTCTMLLGAMANFLYRQPPRADDADHPLRGVVMVPVMAQLEEFIKRFGIEAVCTGYGLTEGSTVLRAPIGMAQPGKVGWPRPDFEVALVDEHDRPVPDGTSGELVLRTHEPWMVMDGYHDMPVATTAAWRNQWLHTGDAFRRDPDGQYVFIDRIKDAMRRRGENVSSFEVEKEIGEHPAVLECAVIAVPSDATEDDIKACVVLRRDAQVEAGALLAFLDDRLPYFMVPRYVEFMAELPKTPTAKIRKQQLREWGLTAATYDRASDPAAPKSRR